ncbi:hypothetical protein [Niveibacterium umoris]|uniref:Uncharacterized protein n=1 Tax=Niveibacterium umoris TaxID=1193620 RepID=A0A840BBY4_9RHOO|nr:hypothetical protein [Niveibacterium umoris]MBB4011051.1 hypothetical protein [Niveibacterium umoris]
MLALLISLLAHAVLLLVESPAVRTPATRLRAFLRPRPPIQQAHEINMATTPSGVPRALKGGAETAGRRIVRRGESARRFA